MLNDYVQLEAGYAASSRADQTVQAAHTFMETFVNASGHGHVAIGPSTSQLLANLALAHAPLLSSTDSIVVHQACHEANAGPWVRLAAATGAQLRWWDVDPHASCASSEDALRTVLTPCTRVVALTHVSNLLGGVVDVASVVRLVRSIAPRARVVVDGVAYAPHLPIDVAAWDVDWYAFSTYKVWGPHAAVLYGKHAAHAELVEGGSGGQNHFWIPREQYVYKFELGGVSHEACAGIVALQHYLQVLATAAAGSPFPEAAHALDAGRTAWCSRDTIEAAYAAIMAMEAPLTAALLEYLGKRGDAVRVLGSMDPTPGLRVPTVSFLHHTKPSTEVAAALQERGFAVRAGHNYAYRLAQAALAGRDVEQGVVRVSALHYNTPEELDRLLAAMGEVL